MNHALQAGRVGSHRPAITIEHAQKHGGGRAGDATLMCYVSITTGPVVLYALATTAGVTPLSDRYGRLTWTFASTEARQEIEAEVLRAVRHLAHTRGMDISKTVAGRNAGRGVRR